MTPLVSIIIPVFNVEKYLRECLDSVLAQTCGDWEALCVDDGSTDSSGAILDEYAARDGRIRVFHQANAGVSAARNKALDEAKGDWICFLDADDILRPDYGNVIRSVIVKHPEIDLIQFGYVKFPEKGVCGWSDGGLEDGSVQVVSCEKEMPFFYDYEGFISRAYSRRIAGGIRFPSLVRGEDCLYSVMCMDRADIICRVRDVLYGYRQREGSAMHSRITVDVLRSEMWLFEGCRILRDSKKTYPRRLWRRLALHMTEWQAERHFTSPKWMRLSLWPEWKAKLLAVRNVRELPAWQRISLRLFAACPCEPVAFCLFFIPQWLKRHGMHR